MKTGIIGGVASGESDWGGHEPHRIQDANERPSQNRRIFLLHGPLEMRIAPRPNDAGAALTRAWRIGSAGVAELVDALVLGTSGESRGGSSPSARTTQARENASRHLMPVRETFAEDMDFSRAR
jgi:hypothetical protein